MIKVFQIHKRSSYIFKDIQDKYSFDNQNNLFAISDGATQGFMSQIWAEQIVKEFIKTPTFEPNELIQSFNKLAEEFNSQEFELDSNPAIKALQIHKKQQGAFATFMGLKLENNSLKYISSGDVCGVVKTENNLVFFPFSSCEELDKDKGFLGTRKLIKGEIINEQFRTGIIPISESDSVVLMTDAIARLILKNNALLDEVLSLNSFDEFRTFIINLWDAKQLEEDDITILYIDKQEGENQEFLATDIEFTKEIVPTIAPQILDMNTENYHKLINENRELKNSIQIKDKEIKLLTTKLVKIHKKIKHSIYGFIGLLGVIILSIGAIYIYKKFNHQKVKTENKKLYNPTKNKHKEKDTIKINRPQK